MTYTEAIEYLNSFINYERQHSYDYNKSFKLERMRSLASLLGNPQDGIKSVHVAGTKGKGSTAAIAYSILKSAGYTVGLYTSPHLVSCRERIRINDRLISESDMAVLTERVRHAVERMQGDKPTFFELYTAIAHLYFQQNKVDFAVYETGLGGRLDATNIINPLVSAITPISYDHTQILGDTLTKIAYEKAGIIKEKGICVSAPQSEEALKTIERVSQEKGARLIVVGKDIYFEEISADDLKEVFNVFGLFGDYPLLEMSLLGQHQVINAACAIGIAEALRFSGITLPQSAIIRGVEEARWEGRMEVVARSPAIVLDGAQNRASANALMRALTKVFKFRNLIVVLGVSKDKDISGIIDEIISSTDFLILTRSKIAERAADPGWIKEMVRQTDKDISLTSNLEEALNRARSKACPEDLILVTGSLFVVGEAREMLVGKTYE